MKKNHLICLSVLLANFSFSASANDALLREDFNKLKEDVVVLQRKIYHDKNDTSTPEASVSHFQMRLGQYDELIRDINGKVENIEYRLGLLEKKIESFNTDIELRFEQFRNNISNNSAPNKTSPTKTAPTPIAKVKPVEGTTPTELYNLARLLLDENKYAEAEEKFLQFLATYPNDTYAQNAQYWLGEVYYKQQKFEKATFAFKEGFAKYPEGAKGPDCLLKLGLSLKALGKNNEACTAFVNIPSEKVNPEISNRAKKEAEALKCK